MQQTNKLEDTEKTDWENRNLKVDAAGQHYFDCNPNRPTESDREYDLPNLF